MVSWFLLKKSPTTSLQESSKDFSFVTCTLSQSEGLVTRVACRTKWTCYSLIFVSALVIGLTIGRE